MMRISNEVANVLANSEVNSVYLCLPKIQLERKLYMQVNKVLTAIGGKWNRKAQAHIFETPPANVVEDILLTGEYTCKKTEYQFFETPRGLASNLVALADIREGETVLEPSAGRGRIASLIGTDKCDCVELYAGNWDHLQNLGFDVRGYNFLDFFEKYDVIIANPPFSRQQDIDHVNHMIDLAKRKVVSVMSAGVLFRDNRKTVEFRDRVKFSKGSIVSLPEKTFAESGTMVRACIVNIDI